MTSYIMMMALMMTSWWWSAVQAAPCCGPKQWAAEVRLVTMDTTSEKTGMKESWHWMSYDLDRQQMVVINFDPNNGSFYERELVDYKAGRRFMTTDEIHCTSSPLTATMPQLCVPPQGGNITLDTRMVFNIWPDPNDVSQSSSPPLHRFNDNRVSFGDLEDGLGFFAETIYYETQDAIGYVTVDSLTCSFVNEMTYAAHGDGTLEWRHTQYNNITLGVDPESFHMPKSCFNSTAHSTRNNLSNWVVRRR